MAKIKIAIVDDQTLFVQSFSALLGMVEDYKVIATAESGDEILKKIDKIAPDIVFVDLEMPGMDGFETTEKLLKKNPELNVLGLTSHDSNDYIIHLIEQGARGYLTKDSDLELISDAVESVLKTGYYLDDKVSKAMVTGLVKRKKIKTFAEQHFLSDREVSVLKLICEECTTNEIAHKLNVSPRTVDGYKEKLFMKTGAKNTIGLVLFAVRNEVI